MMIYISCAKTMTARSRQQVPYTTVPYFEKEAHENAMHMAQFSTEELTRLLRINNKLAAENVLRYHDFLSPDAPSLPALLAYTGIVFKRLNPKDFTEEDWKYAQQHCIWSGLHLYVHVQLPTNGNSRYLYISDKACFALLQALSGTVRTK